MTPSVLTNQKIIEIEKLALEKAEKYHRNSIIGEQIFDILKKHTRLLFYPLNDESIWGFYEKIENNTFICINSSIDFDKQIFAAAHELYHLWFNVPNTLILESDIYEQTSGLSKEELKANRFAAALLMPEHLIYNELKLNEINAIDEIVCIQLARIFFVPYRAMVKRLSELSHIEKTKEQELLEKSESHIKLMQKRLGLELLQKTNTVHLDVLVDKALQAYEQKLITYEKLEYLLSLAHITPEEFGITIPHDEYQKPSLEELHAILEE